MIQLSAPTMDSLPPWLNPAPISSIPSELVEQNHATTSKAVERTRRDLRNITYANFFEHVLTDIAEGSTLPTLCQQDPRGISPAKFLSWILRDPDRKRRYHEALQTNAEIVFSEIIDIADAKHNPMEDVQRSTLKIKTRQWWLGVVDRERFGDIKKLDVTTKSLDSEQLKTISTEELKQMVLSGEYRRVADDDQPLPDGDDNAHL